MASQAKGYLRVPVWIDSGIVKPIADNAGRIPVSIEAAGIAFNVQPYGYVDDTWKKQPIQWGYSDRIIERPYYENPFDTDYEMEFGTVPANEVWIITFLGIYVSGVGCDSMQIWVERPGAAPRLFMIQSPNPWEILGGTVHIVLKEGDSVKAKFFKTGINNKLYGSMAGYILKLNE